MAGTDKGGIALARFVALRNNQPSRWGESEVSQYHEIIGELGAALSSDLSAFRIPDSEMKRQIVGVRRGSFSGRLPALVQRSEKRYCDEQFAKRQIDGVALYLEALQSPPGRPKFGF